MSLCLSRRLIQSPATIIRMYPATRVRMYRSVQVAGVKEEMGGRDEMAV
jgi:hypothetical protein